MKKQFLSVFLVILIFIGCSKKDSPATAAKEFVSSLINGDVKTFNKYATNNTKSLFMLALRMECSENDVKNNMSECLKEMYSSVKSVEVVSVKKINNNKALVVLKETLIDGKIKNGEIPVIKTKDGWKVNIQK